MGIDRASENPIIRPEQVRPSREDFEVIGVFNAGVARLGDEIILLLRVAERPMGDSTDVVLCPIYDVDSGAIVLKPFSKSDSAERFLRPATRHPAGRDLPDVHLAFATGTQPGRYPIPNRRCAARRLPSHRTRRGRPCHCPDGVRKQRHGPELIIPESGWGINSLG